METRQRHSTLPSINELKLFVENKEEKNKIDKYNWLLNQEPPKEFILVNEIANNSNYIPIGIIESMLQRIFQVFKIEVLGYSQLFNAVSCSVRVHYLHPILNEWHFHDGVGAQQIQVKKGESASNLSAINNNAVQMALPSAKSYAIKDACDHLGRIFGRDINREDRGLNINYLYDNELNFSKSIIDRSLNHLSLSESIEDLNKRQQDILNVFKSVENFPVSISDKIEELKTKLTAENGKL